jgi:dipeptidyl aminopeptidase/acylaminoacyl peptidase
MAITYDDGTGPNFAALVDVPTARITAKLERWNFGTFTPDSTQLLSIEEGTLVVRDASNQAVLASMTTTPPRAWVTQPDLSPDGTRLVYVRPTLWDVDWDFRQGQIYTRSYDPATHAFGPEQPLVNDGANNYYPSWSPDGNWVLFTRSDFESSYDGSSSGTWVVKADGSQPPVALAAANQVIGITDSWARWAPFAQTLGAAGEPMFWITMSSKRDFGVRIHNTAVAQYARHAQLWMTPFFPARAQAGHDPSVPAFRLPFQSVDTSNHTAQWTQRIVPIVQ